MSKNKEKPCSSVLNSILKGRRVTENRILGASSTASDTENYFFSRRRSDRNFATIFTQPYFSGKEKGYILALIVAFEHRFFSWKILKNIMNDFYFNQNN